MRKILNLFLVTALTVSCFVACENDTATTTTTVSAWSYPTSDPSTTWTGSGTSVSPYIIKTAQQLADLAYKVNNGSNYTGCYFKLDSDLDLNPNKSANESYPLKWLPIGTGKNLGTASNPKLAYFSGNFDGDGHTIKGLSISQTALENINSTYREYAYDYAGLFGYVKGGLIINLVLGEGEVRTSRNGSSSGYSYTGSLAGYLDDSYIGNCGNEATSVVRNSLSGSYSCLGGLVGGMKEPSSLSGDYCIIGNSYVKTQKVWGEYANDPNSYTGGIVGIMEGNSYVMNCFNNTQKPSKEFPGIRGTCFGGIAGKASSSDNIKWCYWNKYSYYDTKVTPIVGTGSPYKAKCADFQSAMENISGYTSGTLLENLNDWVTNYKSITVNSFKVYYKSWTTSLNPELVFLNN